MFPALSVRRTATLVSVEEQKVGTKAAAMYSRSSETAYKPHSALSIPFQKQIVSQAVLNLLTVGGVQKVGKDKLYLSMQSGARLHLVQVFQDMKTCTLV